MTENQPFSITITLVSDKIYRTPFIPLSRTMSGGDQNVNKSNMEKSLTDNVGADMS